MRVSAITISEIPKKYSNLLSSEGQVRANVSCGLFGISEDFLSDYQSLDERFIKNRDSTFYLKAEGDSMAPLILPNDVLIVDRSIEKWLNRICIVEYQGDLLCKRVVKSSNGLFLNSINPKVKSIKIFEESNSLVWGVVIARIGDTL